MLLVGSVVLVAVVAGLLLAKPLNAIALGESQAALLGVPVERVKRYAVLVTALAVGAVTSTTGMIGFVGLVAPHCVRMVAGPDHRVVLPGWAPRWCRWPTVWPARLSNQQSCRWVC